MRNAWLGVALVGFGCATSATPVQLRRVVLYQNGVGYFEREGRVENGRVALRLAPHEVDDVLTTLTVVERGDVAQQASPSAAIPEGEGDGPRTLTLDLDGEHARDVRIADAAPTLVWRATYRVVLDEDGEHALLQAWAVVHNASPEDWTDVDLALATSAPFAYRVDLRDRRFLERPDATGRGAGAPNRGAVASIATRGGLEHADDLSEQRGASTRAATGSEACSLDRGTIRGPSRSCHGEGNTRRASPGTRVEPRWGTGSSTRARRGAELGRPVCAAAVTASAPA